MAIAEPFANVAASLATVPDVAGYLAVSRSKVYELMDSGELPFIKLGKSRRIQWSAVEAMVRRNLHGGEK